MRKTVKKAIALVLLLGLCLPLASGCAGGGALKLQSRNAGILGERAELFFTLLSGHMLQTFGGMGSISIETLVDALMRE